MTTPTGQTGQTGQIGQTGQTGQTGVTGGIGCESCHHVRATVRVVFPDGTRFAVCAGCAEVAVPAARQVAGSVLSHH